MAQSVITIDATVGGASTNSYLSLADAEILIHQRPFHTAWDKINDDDEKKAALIWATMILSHRTWLGSIVSDAQKQAHPRSGLYDFDGRLYADDEYPEWLTLACSELAYYLATEDRLNDSGTEGYSEIKVASIMVKIDKADRSQVIPDFILTAIRPWLERGAMYNAQVKRV